jgi:hypothetical protein
MILVELSTEVIHNGDNLHTCNSTAVDTALTVIVKFKPDHDKELCTPVENSVHNCEQLAGNTQRRSAAFCQVIRPDLSTGVDEASDGQNVFKQERPAPPRLQQYRPSGL